MLENHPVLRDRLMALATFCGIAIAGISGFEMVIGGALPSIGVSAPAERRGGEMIQADMPWWNTADVTQTNYMPGDAAYAQPVAVATTDEPLAGGADDDTTPDAGQYMDTQEDLLRDAIAALYEQDAATADATYTADEAAYTPESEYNAADSFAKTEANIY